MNTSIDRSDSESDRFLVFQYIGLGIAFLAVMLGLAMAAVRVFRSASGRFAPEASVNLDVTGAGNAADGVSAKKPILRVAIAPVISPESSLETYGAFVDYIATKVDRRPQMLRGKNYSEVNDLIRMRQCDVAMVCTYSYVLAKSEFGAKLLAIPVIDGRRQYYSFIIVSATSKVSSLLDLRNKRFASCDVLSNSGWLYPMTYLIKRGFDTERFFSKHVISGSHDRSVLAVESGVVDGAAVDSVVYEHMIARDPKLKSKLKVIHKSPPFGMPPFIVPSDLPPEVFTNLQRVLLDMHTSDEGRKLLASLDFEGFEKVSDDAYDSVREIAEIWGQKE